MTEQVTGLDNHFGKFVIGIVVIVAVVLLCCFITVCCCCFGCCFSENSTPGAASTAGAGGVGSLFTQNPGQSAIPATTVHNATPAPSEPEMDIHVPFATPVQSHIISSNIDHPPSTFDALQNKL